MKRRLERQDGPQTTAKPRKNGVVCNEPPCANDYVSLELYSSHVSQFHDNVCCACGKNFVYQRILDLHLEECHDPFRDSDSQLKCWHAKCRDQFPTHALRIEHLQRTHHYPSSYDFDIIYKGYVTT
ncbi:LADA_0D01684g1_1 [Lachancea dasiensis]|uniref:LADA_0D01684g1_1 n=1 Tax=Lachancea dasiensis TaxID=1072105 RepID=A0A1G4J4A7_9SACH|nr:LADA_0D01684g1_1 [Lachancea dasiensis]